VGVPDGSSEGGSDNVGAVVVGATTGAFVGAFVGAFTGAFVGESVVGAFVGESVVGAFIGAFVGAFVGESVGVFVGSDVTSLSQDSHANLQVLVIPSIAHRTFFFFATHEQLLAIFFLSPGFCKNLSLNVVSAHVSQVPHVEAQTSFTPSILHRDLVAFLATHVQD